MLIVFVGVLMVALAVALVAAGDIWPESFESIIEWGRKNEFFVGGCFGAFAVLIIESTVA